MSRTILFIGLLLAATSAIGEIRLGDPIEYVDQIMGTPLSRGTVGKIEVLNYKDGTQITVKEGVVKDISVRGQIRIGNETTIPEHAKSSIALTSPVRYEAKPAFQLTPAARPSQTLTQMQAVAAAPLAATNPPPTLARTSNQPAMAAATPLKPDASLVGKVKRMVAGALLVFVAVGLMLHGLFSYCFKRICDRNNEDAGVLIWIPIAQFIPLLRVAKMPAWMLTLILVPALNYAFLVMLFAKICARQNKNPWLAATMVLPVGGLFLIPYLAFAGEKSSTTEKKAEEDEDDSDEAEANDAQDEDSTEDDFMSFDEDESEDDEGETKAKDKKREKEGDEAPMEEFETPFAEMPDPTEQDSKEERPSAAA